MKILIFLAVVAMFFACKTDNKSTSDATTGSNDSLPEGEWNGEYIEVKDSLSEEKKPKKKSRGAEYFNMGTVEVSVDTMEFSIDLFDQKKNHLTLNRNSLVMRIKSAQRDFLSIELSKPDILNTPEGTYPIDMNGSKSISSSIDFNRLSAENPIIVTMKSGRTTLKEFSSGLGKVVLESHGIFQDSEGNEFPGEIKVNMRFESVVSTFNPNS